MSRKKNPKKESMTETEYIATFCQEKRIRHRWAVYVSPETHQKLIRVASVFKDQYVTAMSLADAILSHHFETNGELLNRLHKEDVERIINNLKADTERFCDEDYEPEE